MVKKLLYLNGLAVFGAVLYHASGWGFIAMFWWTDRYRPVSVPNFDQFGSVSYYGLRIIEQLVTIGIPAFLFVSGFFLAFATGRNRVTPGWNVILVRVKNLLIPYVLWSVILLGLGIVTGQALSAGEFIVAILTGRAADPYYFIPVLIQLYLIAPFLIPFARARWPLLLALTAALQFLVIGLRYVTIPGLNVPVLDPLLFLTRSFFFPGYVLFFTLGIVVGFHSQAIRDRLFRFRWALLIATVVTFLLGLVEWELLARLSGKSWIGPKFSFVDQIFSILFILVFLAFDSVSLPLNKWFNLLGTKSYGIYLVHSLVLIYTAKLIYRFAPLLLGMQLVYQILLVSLALAVPLVFMEIVNRSPLRRYYSLLFG